MEENFRGGWLPLDISTHGHEIDQLILYVHILMFVLFIGWAIYLVYVLVKFRERPGHQADVSPKHFGLPKLLEVGIILVEVFLLVGMSIPAWSSYRGSQPPTEGAVVVRVIAEQFAWNFHYPGKDGKFGRTDIKLMDGTNPVGLDREDPDAKDDITTINNFNIPVNTPVIANIRSKDVIHSFSIPVMRVKQDAIPGMEIPIWFQATQTGDHEISCAQLCGNLHTTMKGMFHVLSSADYQAWVEEELKALAE